MAVQKEVKTRMQIPRPLVSSNSLWTVTFTGNGSVCFSCITFCSSSRSALWLILVIIGASLNLWSLLFSFFARNLLIKFVMWQEVEGEVASSVVKYFGLILMCQWHWRMPTWESFSQIIFQQWSHVCFLSAVCIWITLLSKSVKQVCKKSEMFCNSDWIIQTGHSFPVVSHTAIVTWYLREKNI